MSATEEYCDFCDLPKAQCIHGQPPPPPPPAPTVKARAEPKKRVATTRGPAADKPVTLRWTPPDAFKPLILSVLEEAGGQLDADEVFLELEILVEDRFLAGDRELTPEGEPRWRYAARRARVALIDEGLMTKGTPGVWQLADVGQRPG